MICPKCGGSEFVVISNGWRNGKRRTANICLTCKRYKGNKYGKALWARLHREVLTHYSDGTLKCAKCGEDHFEFLALDHMNGDGAQHRREVGKGSQLLRSLQKHGYPPGYRVLCHNCNHLERPKKPWRLEYQREWFRKLREAVIHHYGGETPSCACCGLTDFRILTIDHIEGGGKAHRRITGNGMSFYRWLQKNGYPSGYRILCHNCNHVRGHVRGYVGPCPHESERA
jgi:hypothetical protein